MYRIVDENGNVYVKFPYTKEDIFERMVVSNIDQIFGTSGIYFDVKKLIGVPKKVRLFPMDIIWIFCFMIIRVFILLKLNWIVMMCTVM